MNPVQSIKNLTVFERRLWLVSFLIVLGAGIFSGNGALTTVASCVGVSGLVFVARGDVLGQLFCVVFALLYGAVALSFRYYGEIITYLGMTAPMAVLALVAWLRHPFDREKSEVAVSRLSGKELGLGVGLTLGITVGFYFLLGALGTANLVMSTFSVTTSFAAVYLTFRRSRFYALAYAANDLVLIVLWLLAAAQQPRYLPMAVCFGVFLFNDGYGFVNWSRMLHRQESCVGEKALTGAENRGTL